MPRNDLSPDALAELAALDAILGGEPVGEEHLELAALVDSVRAQAPAWDASTAARVRARLESKRTRARSPRRLWSARPQLALAGGTAVALAVALVAVAASGVLNGGGTGRITQFGPAASSAPRAGTTLHAAKPTFRSAPNTAQSGASSSAPPVGATASSGPTAAAAPAFNAVPATNLATGSTAHATQGVPNTNPANRLVARNASLTLAATPSAMQDVANEVVSSTVRLGGIVESSSVDVHGLSSYASFSLSVPSAKLPALIGALSNLAAVRSLNQGTSDITNTYDAAAATLAEQKAEHTGLLKALATAVTLAEQQAIEAKLTALDAKIQASTGHVDRLLSRGHNAQVSVAIVAQRAAGATSSGPVGRALNDALSVLDVALAIALVALAIVLPVGIVAIVLWWAAASLRHRSREQALASTR